MWYEKSIRRHLLDMHIDDWNPEFLSKFDPDEYLNNLKRAKIQNAMIYLQSHVGLCYYPTKTARMHNAFIGKEDMMKRLIDNCRKEGISVTGYYSLNFNDWAHDNYPEWRMVDEKGLSAKEAKGSMKSAFANVDLFRYGICCPNNPEYRKFVEAQIKEIADYFKLDGMFYDMLYWNQQCQCKCCKKRWEEEVGGEMPTVSDYQNPVWLKLMDRRRVWMGEFAQWVTDVTKKLMPGVSVEHNVACMASAGVSLGTAEEVNNACDYAGGDLYGGIYRQSFVCKLYRNITKNQPFEYMFSRCEPNLQNHTSLKSKDVMLSSLFLTTAHHGATLVIDAIDPVGTMDKRVYDRLGEMFSMVMPYEKYLTGKMIEDVGIYCSLKGKFNPRKEPYTSHSCAVIVSDNMIYNHISYGITGGYHQIEDYPIIIASCLNGEDDYDIDRLVRYVENGGKLYISGGDNPKIMEKLFGAKLKGRTDETVVYMSPKENVSNCFEYYNEEYPMHFDGSCPVYEGIDKGKVLATVTLPYTRQDELKFASIHSNPPGIKTEIPALAVTEYGKGKVLWSALPFEGIDTYNYRIIFMNLIKNIFNPDLRITSDAPKNVELISFEDKDSITVSAVHMNSDYKAVTIPPFTITVKCEKEPKEVLIVPNNENVKFEYKDGHISFRTRELKIYDMYKINF